MRYHEMIVRDAATVLRRAATIRDLRSDDLRLFRGDPDSVGFKFLNSRVSSFCMNVPETES